MICFGKSPSDHSIQNYLDQCRDKDFNYSYVGCTSELIDQGTAPSGFRLDRYSIELGSGEEVFSRAIAAIKKWEMFHHSMASLKWHDTPIENGSMVAVVFGMLGVWTVNPARIVYLLNPERQAGRIRQFGFAYGTVPGHIAIGEECFQVDWNQETDLVQFRITVISRGGSFLSVVGKPVMTIQQKKFRRLAGSAMQLSTGGPEST